MAGNVHLVDERAGGLTTLCGLDVQEATCPGCLEEAAARVERALKGPVVHLVGRGPGPHVLCGASWWEDPDLRGSRDPEHTTCPGCLRAVERGE